MGFSRNAVGDGETLYVASGDTSGQLGIIPQLATIDTASLTLQIVGPILNLPMGAAAELTGTGAGDLFGFYQYYRPGVMGGAIGQIDKRTARIFGQAVLPMADPGNGWAFAFWGGNFYVFTDPSNNDKSAVTRFDPSDGSVVEVAQLNETIVGAGVSTCAPQR
jgi:hypothetical protein